MASDLCLMLTLDLGKLLNSVDPLPLTCEVGMGSPHEVGYVQGCSVGQGSEGIFLLTQQDRHP